LSLSIQESNMLGKFVIAIIGMILFFLLFNFILFNVNSLRLVNQKIQNEFRGNTNIIITDSNDVAIFNNSSENKNRNFISLAIAAVLGLIIFSLSTSHYLVYMVDNSGSMGICQNYNYEDKKCTETLRDSDELKVKKVTDYLNGIISKDKLLGSEKLTKSSLPLLPFYEFTPDIKVSLIEIGGKNYLEGKCTANVLTKPKLNNKEQLLDGLRKIKANDNGTTALVEALKKADYSISSEINFLNYAASKNVILFTDGYEDNCATNTETRKPKTFCEAVNELPSDFNVKLNVYYLSESKDECGQFQCGKKYSANTCKVISTQEIKDGNLPELGLILALPSILTDVSVTTIFLILICIIAITYLILKNGSNYFYPEKVSSFIAPPALAIKNVSEPVINFFMIFLRQEETIPRYLIVILAIIMSVVFVVIVKLLRFL